MNKLDSNSISRFFEALAERKYNENDLSDLTYALCNANDEFRKFWLQFCFDEDIDTNDLRREYQEGFSRPDFFFHDLNNQERIIEVKIYDRNQHFEQYEKKFPEACYAFIANYTYEPVKKWKIKTWNCFCEQLEHSDLLKNEFINGYVKYLKQLINIKEYKEMNLKKLESLPVFIENLNNIFTKEYSFAENNQLKSYNSEFYGQFFYKTNGNDTLYCWIGLYLPENEIYIGFNDDDSWVPEKILKNFKNLNKTDFFEFNEHNDGNFGNYWFKMKKKEVLFNKNNKDTQIQVLKEFIEAVFKTIKAEKYLK